MTNKEIVEMLKLLKEQAVKSCNDTAIIDVKKGSFDFVMDSAITALSQEQQSEWERDHEILKAYADGQESMKPCNDAITRILKIMWNCRGKHTTSIDKVKMEQIIRDELPSVSTEKTGRWIYNPETDLANCSNCGASCPSDKYGRIEVNDCPNCGIKMEAEE